jgi:hypothetical protein
VTAREKTAQEKRNLSEPFPRVQKSLSGRRPSTPCEPASFPKHFLMKHLARFTQAGQEYPFNWLVEIWMSPATVRNIPGQLSDTYGSYALVKSTSRSTPKLPPKSSTMDFCTFFEGGNSPMPLNNADDMNYIITLLYIIVTLINYCFFKLYISVIYLAER